MLRDDGMQVIASAPSFMMNWMDPGQIYDVDIYLSTKNPTEFFGNPAQHSKRPPPIDRSTPVWSLKDIPYSLDAEPNSWNTTIELDMAQVEKDVLANNKTMWVHARLKTDNPLFREKLTHPRHQQLLDLMPMLRKILPNDNYFDSSVPVVAFHQKAKVSETNNLYSEPGMAQAEENAEDEDQTYYPYLKQELNLHVVCDTSVYESRASMMPLVAHLFKHTRFHELGMYEPIVYLSDFWVLMRDLVLVD